MHIKVSIIVPVYNVEPYLQRCVDSLTNQTLKDIEIILVDDGSPDNCGKICDEYAKEDKRIKVIHKKNQGLGMARNSGIEIALGEYIAFVDSDDYVSLDMYGKLYSKSKMENADTCFCSYNGIDSNGILTKYNISLDKNTYTQGLIIKEILINMLGPSPSDSKEKILGFSVWRAIYSKNIFIDNNIKFCSERDFISEDIIFHLDYLLSSKKVTIIKEAFYNYCENNDSLTKSYRKDRFKKNKVQYSEVLRKSQIIGIADSAILRINRSFIDNTRFCIIEEVRYSNKNGKKSTLKNIKDICNDNIIQRILKEYPISELPIKYKIFSVLMKYRMPRMLYLLVKFKN